MRSKSCLSRDSRPRGEAELLEQAGEQPRQRITAAAGELAQHVPRPEHCRLARRHGSVIDLEGVLEHAAAVAAQQRRHVAPEQQAVEVPQHEVHGAAAEVVDHEPARGAVAALPRISVGRIQKPNSFHLPDGTRPSQRPVVRHPAGQVQRRFGIEQLWAAVDDGHRGHRDQSLARSARWRTIGPGPE